MVPVRHHLDVGRVADVEHDGATVDVTHVGTVGPLGEDIGVVGTEASVELGRQARRRGRHIALARAGVPPATLFIGLGRVGDVDDAVDLVVLGVARLEVRRARGDVHGLAVHEPDRMHTPRMRARAVEVRKQARLFRLTDVVDVEAGRLGTELLDLAGHHHDVAHHVQRVGAHLHVRQLGLHDHPRVLRVADVDTREVLGRRFVRHPQDATAVVGQLHGDAFAHATEALQLVVREQFHVVRHRLVGAGAGGGQIRFVHGNSSEKLGGKPARGLSRR